MTIHSEDLELLEEEVNPIKVGEIVVDALHQILPYIEGASTAELMMAYAIMIKSTLVDMELSGKDQDEAKALFDQMYPNLFVEPQIAGDYQTGVVH